MDGLAKTTLWARDPDDFPRQDTFPLEPVAVYLGKDKLTDLALLKVTSKKPLNYVKFADSDKARVGHSVFAIGLSLIHI